MNIKSCMSLLLILGGLLSAQQGFAVCTAKNNYEATIPIQTARFSAGSDLATGSIILAQLVKRSALVEVNCDTTPIIIRMSLSGGMLYPGFTDTFQTGVNGLGVRFRNPYAGRYYPFDIPTSYNPINVDPDGWLDFMIELVKIGPITAGTINTNGFPQVRIDAVDSSNSPSRVAYNTITGSFTIDIPSCTTPNFDWKLGSTNTTVLSRRGDASSWVDTPVTLTGCPSFLGNNSNGSYTLYKFLGDSNTSSQVGNTAPNSLTMTLTPNTSTIDAMNGIIELDSSATATGFGVQVASKHSGTYIAQNLSGGIVVTPAVGDSSGTVSFPLAARIIRTGDSVQGGSISTSLTYTINYQ